MSTVVSKSVFNGANMSLNDILALEANFSNWVSERAVGLKKNIDPFVYYCVEQFVKPFELSDEEILYGIVDGPNDGGVDAIYFLVNRILVREDTVLETRGESKVNLVIIQVKSSNGFSPLEVNKQFFFTDDLLELSRQASTLTTKYKRQLIEIMQVFKEKYSTILGTFPSVTIDYYYITKGDEISPNPTAADAAARVKDKVKQHLNKAVCGFHFINAQRLLEQIQRRPPREKTLVWSETPMYTKEGYVGLVKLRDYYDFIKDEQGELADRIFEANVRGFQQDTPVNKQIRKSLGSGETANFWLLNNGITIIAARAQPAHLQLSLEDPQIVNGLQTSREIFNYFYHDKPQSEERSILIKVIETADAIVQDAVIKATNSQNKMESASLRATDPIHHKIEDLFKQYDLYYDRRKGFYKDKGKPIAKIVSVTELLQAVLSVVLQRPNDARGAPAQYIKDDNKYKQVFGEDEYPLGVYPVCLQIVNRVENYLGSYDMSRSDEQNVKFYIAALLSCRLTQEVDPSPDKLVRLNISDIDDEILKDCYRRVLKMYIELGGSDIVAKGPLMVKRLRKYIKRIYAKKA